jgi:uncharacterized protein (UPF0371 family)
MIDPFHLETYGEQAINYNRDIQAYPVLMRILTKIRGNDSIYSSPTDMGVNRAGFGITDDEIVQKAAVQEIIRRYFRYSCEFALGLADKETVQRVELLLRDLDVQPDERSVVAPARQAALDAERTGKGHEGIYCGAALELADGTIVSGKNSPLWHAASSLILNTLKILAKIPDHIPLIAPGILESIADLKNRIGKSSPSLDLEETLIALAISATTNPAAQLATDKVAQIKGCEVHLTHMPTPGDDAGLRRLGVNLTSDPNFASKRLFIG